LETSKIVYGPQKRQGLHISHGFNIGRSPRFILAGVIDKSWTSTKTRQKVVVYWTRLRARLSFGNFQNSLWPPKTTGIAYKQGFNIGRSPRFILEGSQDLSWQEFKIYLGREPRFILAGIQDLIIFH
jgi:hypothetical protein